MNHLTSGNLSRNNVLGSSRQKCVADGEEVRTASIAGSALNNPRHRLSIDPCRKRSQGSAGHELRSRIEIELSCDPESPMLRLVQDIRRNRELIWALALKELQV